MHKIMMITMKNWRLLLVLAFASIIVLTGYLVIWSDRSLFENHYLNIMKDVNSTETKTEVLTWFEQSYNFTELYDWVHEKLVFVPFNETFERNTDPAKILESGKGRCEEFSILYVAGCLAHGYQSRIIVAVDVGNPIRFKGQHVWAEVKLDGWVHVDPSEREWNTPYMYKEWRWGKDIGSSVRVYAFEDGKYEDVTSNYS